jgi:hypothetical protein
MNRKIIGIVVCTLVIAMIFPAAGVINKSDQILYPAERYEFDFGDAPECGIAYPSTGVIGMFPTCIGCGPAMWVQHTNFGAWFGQAVDFEPEGNGGLCPQCFPPYDQDEGFADGDAGLIKPEPFTINNAIVVVPFPGYTGTPLGFINQPAVWGTNIDIQVHNTMPGHEPYLTALVNVLIDWNQNGIWSDVPGEHVLVNFPVPPLYIGPLSALLPPAFTIGPNPGYVWARFTISEKPVQKDWPGEEMFEDGETEDYLLLVEEEHIPVPDLSCRGSIVWKKITTNTEPLATKTGTFDVGNVGDLGSLLNWQVTAWPSWGTWTFSPSSGTGLAAGSWITVNVTCVPPNQPNTQFTGNITVKNTNDATDFCLVSVSLKTAKNKVINAPFLMLLEKLVDQFPSLKWLLNL